MPNCSSCKRRATGERTIVGVNRYDEGDPQEVPLLRIDPHLETHQRERVAEVRARRDSDSAAAALERLRAEATDDTNLMPAIIDAARAHVTVGEMCDTLRATWGVWRETPVY